MVDRFAVKIAYLGKNYHGFQRQKTGIKTIEGEIIKTLIQLGMIDKVIKASYSAAGRTDAGVHALGQVIAFNSLRKDVHLEELNHYLPDDIFAWGLAKVKGDFNARRHAKKRTYRYYIPYAGENIPLMKKGLSYLIGTHNFENFCKKPDILHNGKQKLTNLTLDDASVQLVKKDSLLMFEFTSESFLWKQVRKMVSMILVIGREIQPISVLQDALEPTLKIPKGGIRPVSPDGLVLYEVKYSKVHFSPIEKKHLIENELKKKISSYTSTLAVLTELKKSILTG
ncbi:MAG: tRNA pseudouridine(38-40) synthase TruA [Candidatus Heimdallarchaeota archaeon]